MKRLNELVKEYNKVLTLVLSIVLIFVTWRIGTVANNILDKQTEILDTQAELQDDSFKFDQDKLRVERYYLYRKNINELFDMITYTDHTMVLVHDKLKNNEKIIDIKNLDRYVDNFEDIGMLYCDGSIKLEHLRGILKTSLATVCNSEQIYNHYRNTKSGISAMCKQVHPQSKMAKWNSENGYKCGVLN